MRPSNGSVLSIQPSIAREERSPTAHILYTNAHPPKLGLSYTWNVLRAMVAKRHSDLNSRP